MGSKSDMKLVKIEAYSLDSPFRMLGSSHCFVVTEDRKTCWLNYGRGWSDDPTRKKVAENQAYWEWLMEFVPPSDLDRCGIRFGMNGLCHSYAARELLLGRNDVNVSGAPKNYVCVFFFGKYGMGLDDLKKRLKDSYTKTTATYHDPYNALDEVLRRVDNTVDFELSAWRQVAMEYAGVPVDDIMAKNPQGGLATARARMRDFINKRENVYLQHKNETQLSMERAIAQLIQTESDSYLNMLANIRYISEKDKSTYSSKLDKFLRSYIKYVDAQRQAYLATGQVPENILLEDYIDIGD